ncbi:MAG: hypothetical protein U0U67_05955 [Chitinophagales bacterium]
MSLKNNILLTCKEATLLTCKKQEQAVTVKEKLQLWLHLLICRVCSLFYKQSTLLHEHLTNMHNNQSEFTALHLDEAKKAALQQALDKAMEK